MAVRSVEWHSWIQPSLGERTPQLPLRLETDGGHPSDACTQASRMPSREVELFNSSKLVSVPPSDAEMILHVLVVGVVTIGRS